NPAAGSSSIRSPGSVASALPISSILCSPIGRLDAVSFILWPSLIYSSISSLLSLVSLSSFTAKGSLSPDEMNPAFVFECLPTMIFSSVVISPKSSRCWNVRAMPLRDMLRAEKLVMSNPEKKTSPLSGAVMPVTISRSVVFPAPLGPIRALMDFSRALKFTLLSAASPPKLFDTFLTSSNFWAPLFYFRFLELVNDYRDDTIPEKQQRKCENHSICKHIEFLELP